VEGGIHGQGRDLRRKWRGGKRFGSVTVSVCRILQNIGDFVVFIMKRQNKGSGEEVRGLGV
jgi:hypothetical protein